MRLLRRKVAVFIALVLAMLFATSGSGLEVHANGGPASQVAPRTAAHQCTDRGNYWEGYDLSAGSFGILLDCGSPWVSWELEESTENQQPNFTAGYLSIRVWICGKYYGIAAGQSFSNNSNLYFVVSGVMFNYGSCGCQFDNYGSWLTQPGSSAHRPAPYVSERSAYGNHKTGACHY